MLVLRSLCRGSMAQLLHNLGAQLAEYQEDWDRILEDLQESLSSPEGVAIAASTTVAIVAGLFFLLRSKSSLQAELRSVTKVLPRP
jgi:predicted PurR-regulated permease PerM